MSLDVLELRGQDDLCVSDVSLSAYHLHCEAAVGLRIRQGHAQKTGRILQLGWKEGRKAGRQEGWKDGRKEEGSKEGRKQGRKVGRQEGRKDGWI